MAKDLKIKNRKDAEVVLGGLAEDKAALAVFRQYADDYSKRVKAKEEALTAWVEAHPEELGPNNLLSLESGQIKRSVSSSVKWDDAEQTLDYVQKHNLSGCFKVDIKLVRDGFRTLDPDVMKAAGAYIATESKITLKPLSKSPRCSIQFC